MTQTSKASGQPLGEAPGAGDADDEEACPECGSHLLQEDGRRGETTCLECGLVISEGAIDQGPDWRAYNATQHRERARAGPGRTIMRHDHGLGSQIGWESSGASPEKRAQLSRMRTYHQRATYKPGADRGLARGLSEIDRLTGALDLPDTVGETAARIYRQAREADFIHGRSVEGTAAAAVYAAARIHRVPRQLDRVSEVAQTSHEDVARTYRRLHSELELPVPTLVPTDLLPSIASTLGVPGKVEKTARDLIEAAEPTRLSGKNPASVAAAALYLAVLEEDEHRTQKDIAEAAGITDVTLRNRLADLDPDR